MVRFVRLAPVVRFVRLAPAVRFLRLAMVVRLSHFGGSKTQVNSKVRSIAQATAMGGWKEKEAKESFPQLTFQKTEEDEEPVEHLCGYYQSIFLHKVEKDQGWVDVAFQEEHNDRH